MTTPADVLSASLTALANDRRRTVTQYANIEPRPGEADAPRRLLSDIGFPEATQFSYVNAHPSHVIPPQDEEPRTIRQFVIKPYGLSLDLARFNGRNRNIRTTRGANVTGVAAHPDDDTILISAELAEDTYSAQKNEVVIRNMTTRRSGPAYHFLIDRRGGLSVGPGLDYATSVNAARSEDGVFIGMEGALGLSRTNFAGRHASQSFELPYTAAQIEVLVILLAKLQTAFPEVRLQFQNDASPGVLTCVYEPAQGLTLDQQLNFTNERWQTSTVSPFEYSATDDAVIAASVSLEGAYDLATEVFRTAEAPRAIAARDAARVAIGQIDTAGRVSVAMGAYVYLASPERANSMEGQSRRELFVTRERASHQDANSAGQQSSTVTNGTQSVTPIHPTISNAEPHVYDYDSGIWGDGAVY